MPTEPRPAAVCILALPPAPAGQAAANAASPSQTEVSTKNSLKNFNTPMQERLLGAAVLVVATSVCGIFLERHADETSDLELLQERWRERPAIIVVRNHPPPLSSRSGVAQPWIWMAKSHLVLPPRLPTCIGPLAQKIKARVLPACIESRSVPREPLSLQQHTAWTHTGIDQPLSLSCLNSQARRRHAQHRLQLAGGDLALGNKPIGVQPMADFPDTWTNVDAGGVRKPHNSDNNNNHWQDWNPSDFFIHVDCSGTGFLSRVSYVRPCLDTHTSLLSMPLTLVPLHLLSFRILSPPSSPHPQLPLSPSLSLPPPSLCPALPLSFLLSFLFSSSVLTADCRAFLGARHGRQYPRSRSGQKRDLGSRGGHRCQIKATGALRGIRHWGRPL